jgi:hypothetical protein
LSAYQKDCEEKRKEVVNKSKTLGEFLSHFDNKNGIFPTYKRTWITELMGRLGWYRKPKPKKKRICVLCGEQIKRNHKWTDKGMFGSEHRNCEIPTGTNNDIQVTLPL